MGVVAWQGVALWPETRWQLSRAAETEARVELPRHAPAGGSRG